MRLTLASHAHGLSATVVIERPGDTREVLVLAEVRGDHHVLQSDVAPQEPREFGASLNLSAGGRDERLPFAMKEPPDHHH